MRLRILENTKLNTAKNESACSLVGAPMGSVRCITLTSIDPVWMWVHREGSEILSLRLGRDWMMKPACSPIRFFYGYNPVFFRVCFFGTKNREKSGKTKKKRRKLSVVFFRKRETLEKKNG